MIKLTNITSGSPEEIYISVDKIISVYPLEGGSGVFVVGEIVYGVSETPEVVVSFINRTL